MKVDILGVDIDAITKERTLKKIEHYLSSDSSNYIVTVNSEFVLMANEDNEFKNILNGADLSLADGIGILMAAKYLRGTKNRDQRLDNSYLKKFLFSPLLRKRAKRLFRFPISVTEGLKVGLSIFINPSYLNIISERISGADLVLDICKICENKQKKIFLLGRRSGLSSVGEYKKVLQKLFSRLKVEVAEINIHPKSVSTSTPGVREKIKSFRPDVLFVTLGMGYQEKWIYKNRDLGVPLSIGLGGSLDYLVGRQTRAPKFFQKFGLEWFVRPFITGDTLMNKIKRIRRVFSAVVIFPLKIFLNSLEIKN